MKTLILSLFLFTCLAKIQAQTLDWAWGFGNNQLEIPSGMTTDSHGNIYTIGAFKGSVDFDPGPNSHTMSSQNGTFDGYIQKMNVDGNFLDAWRIRCFGDGYINDIAIDNSGNIIVVGEFRDSIDLNPSIVNYQIKHAHGQADGFIIKLDSTGLFLWGEIAGGPGFDGLTAVDFNSTNDLIAAGNFQYIIEFSNSFAELTAQGADDMFLWQITSLGNWGWTKRIGGNSGNLAFDVKYDHDQIVLCGQASGIVTSSFQGANVLVKDTLNGYEGILMRMSNNGTDIFFKSLSSTIKSVYNKMALDANGNVYICGNSQGDTDFDPGPLDFILGTNANSLDPFIAAYDSTGYFKWAKNFGSTSTDNIADISLEGDQLFTTGHYVLSCNFHTNGGNLSYTANGISDIFIHVLDTNSNFYGATSIGAELVDQGVGIVASNGKVFNFGIFQNLVDFDPSANALNLQSTMPSQDVYVLSATYSFPGVSLEESNKWKPNINLFPNPTEGIFQISGIDEKALSSIEISNAMGQIIIQKQIDQTTCDISHLKKGMYWAQIKLTDASILYHKIILH